ncbi:MAG: peptidoglycan-associated lipoprotein Pal [Mariprofundaceae bacterium]
MNLKHFSKLALLALAITGLLFAGCTKKELVSNTDTITNVPVVKQIKNYHTAKPHSNSIYFEYDSAALDEANTQSLHKHAAWLVDHAAETVTVEGNCDQRGSREYNLALGQRRADTVKAYLIAQGVDANRIDTVSFGEERPACTGTGEACWAQNRHADLATR